MAIQFTITIEDTQIINGGEYTQAKLQQGLAQVRTAYNLRTGESLTDAEWLQWAILQDLAAWYEQGKYTEPVPPSPIYPVADWSALRNEILSGSLRPLYERLASYSLTNHQFSTPFTIITASILTVHTENAVREAIMILLATGYQFLPEEVSLWNTFVSSIGFSETVLLSE